MRCRSITTFHNMAFNEGVIFIGHTVLISLTVADIIVFEPNTHTPTYTKLSLKLKVLQVLAFIAVVLTLLLKICHVAKTL